MLTSALLRILAHFLTTGSKASSELEEWNTKHRFHIYSFRVYVPSGAVMTLGKPITLYPACSSSSHPVPVVRSVTRRP